MITKKINVSLKPYRGELFFKNGAFKVNTSLNIWFNFKKRLSKFNIDINTIDLDSKNVNNYIFCDVPYPWEVLLWYKLFFDKAKKILFCFESPIVDPFSHIKWIHGFFKRVYTWDDRIIDSKKYFKFFYPQVKMGLNTKFKKFEDKDFLVLINSNKMSPWIFKLISPYKTDLYIERIKAIEFFESYDPKIFHLYGYGWNKPKALSIKEKLLGFKKYRTYRGVIKDKFELLSRFKFSLVFENCIADGYITDKIFDCFKAGCVPIYLGDPNIGSYISSNCFIDFRRFKNYEELVEFLNKIDEKSYNSYINKAQQFISSNEFLKIWSDDAFEKILLDSISYSTAS